MTTAVSTTDAIHTLAELSQTDTGIDAVSVNVDAVDRTRRSIAAAEQRRLLSAIRTDHPTPGGRVP